LNGCLGRKSCDEGKLMEVIGQEDLTLIFKPLLEVQKNE
jgi:hypothetical protein